MPDTTLRGPHVRWVESACECMGFTKSEENEWGVREITLEFLQGIHRNQASTGQGAPKAFFFLYGFFLFLTVIPAPLPLQKHTHRHMHPTHKGKHTQQCMARGVVSLCPIKILL